MTPKYKTDVAECREAALSFLDRRPYSTEELRRKLWRKKFDRSVISDILADLAGTGLLDDLEYAVAYCEYRMEGSRPMGTKRVQLELRKRGVEQAVIRQALATFLEARDLDFEYEKALEAGCRKHRSVSAKSESRKTFEKVYSFLMRRGFSADICCRVLDRLRNEESP